MIKNINKNRQEGKMVTVARKTKVNYEAHDIY